MKKIIVISVIALLINISPVIADCNTDSQLDELPSSFCWRNINGTDFTTPIKNQAPAPTCEAYALVSAVETLVQYELGYPFDCDLSEAHLFFYAGGTTDWGVRVIDACEYLIEHGVPDEGCYPDPHRPYDPDSNDSLAGWENRTVKITEWGWVENSVDSIKHALVEHGPLIVCILQRNDFLRYRGGVYTPHRWMEIQSGHVVTLVGYDDADECWILRNSAGTGWGEDGYARISYSAHNPYTPFFWPFYGFTGIFYVDGVYGNFQPGVPQAYITNPKKDHTYIFGRELPTFFTQIKSIQKRSPRIFGPVNVNVGANNTNYVKFYLDGELKFTDEEEPYEWELDTTKGMHTIEVYAHNEHNTSKDILDVFVFT
jgi:hypothetical protein